MIMNEEPDLRELEQHTFRVAHQDGLIEILSGLMIMAIGILLVNRIFVVYVAILIVFQAVAIEGIKERYTYPRIGRVKLKPELETDYGPYWPVFAVAMIVALTSVIASIYIQNELIEIVARWAPLIMGIGLLQQFVTRVQRSGLRGYYGVSAVITVLGAVFVFLEIPLAVDRMLVYLLIVGGCLFLAGVGSLVRFVRKYPVLDLEDVGNEQD